MTVETKGELIAKESLVNQLHGNDVSLLKRYQKKAVGTDSYLHLLQYELSAFLFGNVYGSMGYILRKWSYRSLFNNVGGGVILGRGISLRHPSSITVGHRVAIDDYVLLDASGAGEEGVVLGNDVIISRNCVIQGKLGPITLGDRTDIGCNTIISSVTGVYVGTSVLIAGNCYIGGGRYVTNRLDIPMMAQGLHSKGPVIIEDDVWLGAGAVVLDGVRIGKGCIVGAGAVVTKDLPDYAIATGVPATVIRMRDENEKSVVAGAKGTVV